MDVSKMQMEEPISETKGSNGWWAPHIWATHKRAEYIFVTD